MNKSNTYQAPGGGGDSQINVTGIVVEIVEKHP